MNVAVEVRVKHEPSFEFSFNDGGQFVNFVPDEKIKVEEADDKSVTEDNNFTSEEQDLVIVSLHQLWMKLRVCWKLINSHMTGVTETMIKDRYVSILAKNTALQQSLGQSMVFGIKFGVNNFIIVINGKNVLQLLPSNVDLRCSRAQTF